MQRPKKRTTISKAMPNLKINGGLFNYIPQYGTVTAYQLGLLYDVKRSGDKQISALVSEYLNEGVVSTAGEQALGLILTNVYKDKWDRIWEVISQEYNALENTDKLSEIKSIDSGSDTFTKGEQTNTKGQEQNTIGSQSITVGAREDTTEQQKAGYNVSTYSPNEKEITNVGQQQNTNGQRQDTFGEREDTEGEREDTTKYGKINTLRESTHGNIGTMKTQELLESEIAVRQYNFYEQIFADIDKFLAIEIY